jgi:hypothetical protein
MGNDSGRPTRVDPTPLAEEPGHPTESNRPPSARRVYKPRYDIFYRHECSLRRIEACLRAWLLEPNEDYWYAPRDYIAIDQLRWPSTTTLDMPSYRDAVLQSQYKVEWTHSGDSEFELDLRIRILFDLLSGIEPRLSRGKLRSVGEALVSTRTQVADNLVYPTMPIALYGWLLRNTTKDEQATLHLRDEQRRQKVGLLAPDFPDLRWPPKLLQQMVFVMGLIGSSLDPLTIEVGAVFF